MARMFADPVLAPHLLDPKHRTVSDDQTFWGSPEFRELDEHLGNVLTRQEGQDGIMHVLVSLGMDGVQLLNWGSRTATVAGIKVEDLPAHLSQTKAAVFPVMVIEGVQEPHNIQPALQLIVDFFHDHRGVFIAM